MGLSYAKDKQVFQIQIVIDLVSHKSHQPRNNHTPVLIRTQTLACFRTKHMHIHFVNVFIYIFTCFKKDQHVHYINFLRTCCTFLSDKLGGALKFDLLPQNNPSFVLHDSLKRSLSCLKAYLHVSRHWQDCWSVQAAGNCPNLIKVAQIFERISVNCN